MTPIATQISKILEQINQFAQAANRSSDEVELLAVSKTKPVEDILAAYEAGQRAFGENYVNEALEKIDHFRSNQQCQDIEWHYIGPIQSNKTKPIAENFAWVQSVDRLKLVTRLNDQRPEQLPPLNVCVQINISGEETKSGCQLAEVNDLAAAVEQSPRLVFRGIMAVPEHTDDIDKLEEQYQALLTLWKTLQSKHATCDTLSVGMTQDMKTAIKFGSTMVRIGTAIFGSRG